MPGFAAKSTAKLQVASLDSRSRLNTAPHLNQAKNSTSSLQLQRTFGNHAIESLLNNNVEQPRLVAKMESTSLRTRDMEEPEEPKGFGLIDREDLFGLPGIARSRTETDPFRTAPFRHHGGTLPYREATELTECIRIMGDENAAYCHQEVLGEAPPPPLSVTVPDHIRATSTPREMPDRIPPRINTPVTINISGWQTTMPPVRLSVQRTGPANGRVTINGANNVDLTATTTVQLRGMVQTTPGSANGLHLVATHHARSIATSTGFSVSAIPQNWSVTLHSLITGPERGIEVNNNWESDSGNVADLDMAQRSEQVQYGAGTGCFAGVTGDNSHYRPADSPPLVDHHAAPVGMLTSPGRIVAEQTFTFIDDRTGAVDIPAKRSGYRLTREVTEPVAGSFSIVTTKAGTATSANGFASDAGAGTVTSGPQAV